MICQPSQESWQKILHDHIRFVHFLSNPNHGVNFFHYGFCSLQPITASEFKALLGRSTKEGVNEFSVRFVLMVITGECPMLDARVKSPLVKFLRES